MMFTISENNFFCMSVLYVGFFKKFLNSEFFEKFHLSKQYFFLDCLIPSYLHPAQKGPKHIAPMSHLKMF